MSEKKENNGSAPGATIGLSLGMTFGVALGAAFGVALDNLALGVGVGIVHEGAVAGCVCAHVVAFVCATDADAGRYGGG